MSWLELYLSFSFRPPNTSSTPKAKHKQSRSEAKGLSNPTKRESGLENREWAAIPSQTQIYILLMVDGKKCPFI